MAGGVRIRLDLSNFIDDESCLRWAFVSYGKFEKISDLSAYIACEIIEKDDLRHALKLFLEEPFCLPPKEDVRILHNGDLIKVKALLQTKKKESRKHKRLIRKDENVEDVGAISPPSKKIKRKKKVTNSPEKVKDNKRNKGKRSEELEEEGIVGDVSLASVEPSQVVSNPEVSLDHPNYVKENDAVDMSIDSNDAPPPRPSMDNASSGEVNKKKKRKRKRKPKNKNKLPDTPDVALVSDEPCPEIPVAVDHVETDVKESPVMFKKRNGNGGNKKHIYFDEDGEYQEKLPIEEANNVENSVSEPSATPHHSDGQHLTSRFDFQKPAYKRRLEPSSRNISCEEVLLGHICDLRPSKKDRVSVVEDSSNGLEKKGPQSLPRASVTSSVPNFAESSNDNPDLQKLLGLAFSSPLCVNRPQHRQTQQTTPSCTNDVYSNNSVMVVNKVPRDEDFSKMEPLLDMPSVGDLVAFKVLEMGPNYTPSVSSYKTAIVLSMDSKTKSVNLKLEHPTLNGPRVGRFEMGEEEENVPESDRQRESLCDSTYALSDLIELKLLVSHRLVEVE